MIEVVSELLKFMPDSPILFEDRVVFVMFMTDLFFLVGQLASVVFDV